MKEEKCDVVDIWEVLGKRWSLHILKNLSINGIIRFNELKRLIPEISSTVLSQRLLELEREGLISKKIYSEIPVRVEYSLTPRTKELEIILQQLNDWINRWKAYEKRKETKSVTATTTLNSASTS
ncbi:MAG TPA: helix-turn-helix domain-containing protein [Candidatus Nitrosocosmicus sp.]|jgi:DNA-binding HxlR family transcriptional regulator|nr:helix-turn-helix domain-containing protein [Candidatus Nitrosocosmicus sp.]